MNIKSIIGTFEAATKASADSKQLTAKIKASYPNIGGDSILDLSAKVIMGEIPWGQ